MSMLTFFAASCNNTVNDPSLQLYVSVIVDDMETVSEDSRRANVGDTKKNYICVDPLNVQ
jgi:hypothetical protein